MRSQGACTRTHPSTRLLPQQLISLRDLSTASRETEREAEHRLSCIGESDAACGLNSRAAEELCCAERTGIVLHGLCALNTTRWESWAWVLELCGGGGVSTQGEKKDVFPEHRSFVVWLWTKGVWRFCVSLIPSSSLSPFIRFLLLLPVLLLFSFLLLSSLSLC